MRHLIVATLPGDILKPHKPHSPHHAPRIKPTTGNDLLFSWRRRLTFAGLVMEPDLSKQCRQGLIALTEIHLREPLRDQLRLLDQSSHVCKAQSVGGEIVAALDSLSAEIEIHRAHLGTYGYVFYIAEMI